MGVWKDLSGNGNDGVVSGAPETILLREARNGRDVLGMPINNVNNGYLALHGDGYVEVADDASLDMSNYSVDGWFKYPSDITGMWYSIMTKHLQANWQLFINTGRKLSLYNATDGGMTLATEIDPNTWYHFALTESNGTLITYINGIQKTSKTVTPTFSTTGKLIIGRHQSSDYLTGSIDEPRIYSRALTEAEVLQNYNASKNKHRND